MLSVENKITIMNGQFDKQVVQNTEFDSEFNQINNYIKKMENDHSNLITRKDGQRIWRQLQRFAEYEDLKELY